MLTFLLVVAIVCAAGSIRMAVNSFIAYRKAVNPQENY